MKGIRYVIMMKNGSFMKQEFDETTPMRVVTKTVDNPIDATLFRDKTVAIRVIDEMLSGNTNLLVLYDEDNPPTEVCKIEVEYNLNKLVNK